MKKILIVAAGVLCSVAVYVGASSYINSIQTDLMTQNIEALTQGESSSGKYMCAGIKNPCTPEVGNVFIAPLVRIP